MSNLYPNIYPHLKVSVPSFLIKTYEILENDSLSHLISWNSEGTAFIVYNPNELSSQVLANYFKHKNYPSFLRQLNMYNFKKTRNQYGFSEFRHKWFRKGQQNMIQYIRRRNQEESDQKIDTREQNQELDFYKQEHENIKILIQDLQTGHKEIQKNLAKSLDQSTSLNKQNFITLQKIHQTQLEFNKKYDYVTLMLTNVLTNLPNICIYQSLKTVTNFKEAIKICQDEPNIYKTLPCSESGASTPYPQVFPYNQYQFYTQKQQPCILSLYKFQDYFYDQNQYFYKNTPQLAITDVFVPILKLLPHTQFQTVNKILLIDIQISHKHSILQIMQTSNKYKQQYFQYSLNQQV
ncbi:unnamed protein product (macronuclear) [Paramecium tetraurelia]|uniref:HSF-type DNA-binding domain-containing protein n=1 Tax=Paramecium tetraurelia TaxID=5888 RepID=A0EG39_PARTE|nr:uncharacterized protein GSPATT00026603001 [Paramecium tetraurelia]CAK94280.1 unnamed protein product [Paramecium tetraurelia]|eukprot:XP_001461653.1 hypothetical protein (macronuclear) [Paramecium tetraurelia strain d4-2]